jgi:RNA polymerase sigma factor (sigma-70 family)
MSKKSTKFVHLTKAQKKRKRFSHPLTDNPPPALVNEQLNEILKRYIAGEKELRNDLILGNIRFLRSIIARYLYYWPITRPFLDEMVSTGVEAIIEFVDSLTLQVLDKEYTFIHLLGWKIRREIAKEINNLRAIVSAPDGTNRYFEQVNKPTIYREKEVDLTDIQNTHGYFNSELIFFEIHDILEAIVKNDKEAAIIAKENWGLSNKEIAQKIGMSERQVRRIRFNLLEKYYELTGD